MSLPFSLTPRLVTSGAALGLAAVVFAACDRQEEIAATAVPVTESVAAPAVATTAPEHVAIAAVPAPPAAPVAKPAVPAAQPRVPRSGPIFSLPTKNDALLTGKPENFFMFVDRYTPEGAVQVWQGGSYGYVRNPRTTSSGEVFTKFHEGIDIAPVDRDAAGEPLDLVNAIADGTVVFCSPNAQSNYGNYVVMAHLGGEDHGTFYSLYAHLKRIDTRAGQPVKRGAPIGLMGHTGDGIDRRRSHVHLELCLLLSERFDDYYGTHYKLGNPYGNYHGHNLIGMDVSSFLKAAHAEPGLRPDEFLKTAAKPYYRVRIPNRNGQELDIARRYPWLRKPGLAAASWEISVSGTGVPLAIAPSKEACTQPTVVWVQPFTGYHSWNTRSHLGGSGNTATLAPEGQRYLQLVTGDFPVPPPPAPAGTAPAPGSPKPPEAKPAPAPRALR